MAESDILKLLNPEYDPADPGTPRAPTDLLRSLFPGINFGFMNQSGYGSPLPQPFPNDIGSLPDPNNLPTLEQIKGAYPNVTGAFGFEGGAAPAAAAPAPDTAPAAAPTQSGGTVPTSFSLPPPKSTADLTNWRNRYGPNPLYANIPFVDLRKTAYDTANTINRMPWVFNPGNYPGANTDALRSVIFPGVPFGENSKVGLFSSLLQKPGTQSVPGMPSTDQVTSLLSSLTAEQRSALTTLLGQTALTGAPGGASTSSTFPVTSEAQNPPVNESLQAARNMDDAYFGLPPGTLSFWRLYGPASSVSPQTNYFYMGLPAESQLAFLSRRPVQPHSSSPGQDFFDELFRNWKPPVGVEKPSFG